MFARHFFKWYLDIMRVMLFYLGHPEVDIPALSLASLSAYAKGQADIAERIQLSVHNQSVEENSLAFLERLEQLSTTVSPRHSSNWTHCPQSIPRTTCRLRAGQPISKRAAAVLTIVLFVVGDPRPMATLSVSIPQNAFSETLKY